MQQRRVAPFIAWIRSFQRTYLNKTIDFYYCCHSNNDMVLVDEIEQTQSKYPNFRFFPFCSEQNKHINSSYIDNLSRGLKGKDILMCGPKSLTKDLSNQFKALGVDAKNIFFEDFEFF
jgi:predicted ferric reductase